MKKRTLFVCFLIFTLCVFHSLIPSTVLAQEDASSPQQVFETYEDTLLRADLQTLVVQVLTALSDPVTLQNPILATLGGLGPALDLVLQTPVLIRQVVPDADDSVIALLTDDQDIRAFLMDANVRTLLQDSEKVKELLGLVTTATPDPVVPDPVVPDPVVPDPVVPDPVVPDPVVPDPVVPDPVVPDPVVPPGPTVDLTPSVLNGQSRLGGLSLNRVHARGFIRDMIAAAGLSRELADAQVENVVDAILAQVPQGFLPKKQIKQMFTARQPTSIFQNEAPQLDFENFGNAVVPALSEVIYTNVPNSTKYLASNNLNLYVRVPATLEGGSVQFMLDDRIVNAGQRITPAEFQADTIPYTFRLEESLAATNLPAWPDLGSQLFSGVVLRYSQTGLDGDYIAVDMDPVQGENGVVWESKIGIIPKDNTHYYFEVTLLEPVMLEVLNPEAIFAAIDSPDGTHSLEATNTYEINSWAMPDPKNLQLDDRGILEALFTPDVVASVIPIAASALVDPTATIPGSQLQNLQNALLRSANDLFTTFEGNFDPLLASVFSLPDVDIETESLWYANIEPMASGGYGLADTGMPSKIDAIVLDADGNAVDHISVDFTVDTSAPTADIAIGPAENATGYWNKDGVFVATAPAAGTASLVNIRSTNAVGVGQGQGYLIYQMIDLDGDGNPEGTWLPLTVENSMVASDLWKIVQEQLEGITDPNIQLVAGLSVDALLGLLQADIAGLAGPFLEDFGIKLSDEQITLLGNLLGASIEDLNLIPVTFDPTRDMTIPIQGENIPLLVGDYGIRAMGIDTLFNVGSYVPPTRFRVVIPETDRTSITFASLGDLNGDGDADEPYESGTIFKNATDVTLTVSVNERTVHPGTVIVQYMDAAGEWQNIGELTLAEAEGLAGDTLTIDWNVTDFDALVMAGDTVAVRTVTTNGLQLTDESETFTINLDNDVHPVDPEVLVVGVDANSIVMTNPDSGAPQGTISLEGYSPRRTVPATSSIRIDTKRMNDEAWAAIGTVELSDPNGMNGEATAPIEFKGKTIGDVHVYEMPTLGEQTSPHINLTSSYLKWIVTVDTTLLEDSITVDSPGARDASMDDNRYMVRAYVVGDDGADVSAALEGEVYTEMFSVDNDDDVAPLGPTNITDVAGSAGSITANEDGSYTVGGIVDKYDPALNSPIVTLTITPTAVRRTYASVKLLTTLPEGAIIGDITETAEGSGVFTVTIDVGTLMDGDEFVHNDRYIEDTYIDNPDEFVYNPKGGVFTFTVHALAYDNATPYDDVTAADEMFLEYGNVQADDYDGDEITINVQNSYRHDPGVIAIAIENSDGMTNPDSGAPQGELTFNVYTYYITSPPTEGIRVEAKRPVDDTWERITGTAVEPVEVDISDVPGIGDLDDITGGLVGITEAGAVSGGESKVGIPTRFMKWQYIVDTRALALEDTVTADDTIKLDDTIARGDASERDISIDENMYQVRAISLTPKNLDHPEYPQRDGVGASFSLDNVDDVPPLGPTNITDVADVAGSITAHEDGSYTVGGIVDPTVDSPIAIFTIEPTADSNTYVDGKTILVQTAPDGTVTETDGSLEEGSIQIDVGQLANGAYMYHALVADEFGNVQVQGEADLPSPVITVHVLNIRVSDITDLNVTAVDGESPDRHLLQETVGELQGRFPLKESISVSFNVNNGSLAVGDLTGVLIDGHTVTFSAGSDAENAFSLMADKLSDVVDGWYTPHGQITKRNGSVTFPLATINLDNTAPILTIETPVEGATVNDLPTLLAGFGDGDLGSGISDGSGVSLQDTAVVSLARLRPEEVVQDAVDIVVDQSMVEQDLDSVVYTRTDKLAGGAYMFTIQVSDILGNVGEQSVTFAIEGINPTVVITAPASGQTFDHSPASITGFFAGGGEVNITKFTINDVDMTAEVVDNNFTYMPTEALGDDDYTVEVEVTDGSGLTAKTSLTFTVELPIPTVAIHSPHAAQTYDNGNPIIAGDFSGAPPIEVSLSIDGEAVEASVNDNNQFTYTPTDALSDGEHVVTAIVTDANGRTAETSTDFTIDIPGPVVAIHAPAAGKMYDYSKPIITGDFSGFAPIVLNLILNGEVVEAEVSGNGFTYTPADALGDGQYTLVAEVTDGNGKKADATIIFSIRLPVPTVAIHSPHAAQTYDNGKPIIAGDFSGAPPIEVSLSIDGEAVEASVNDNNQFTYTPTDALSDGEHVVTAIVTDANGRTAETSTDFTIDIPGPVVAIHAPAAGKMYDYSKPIITGDFSGFAPIVLNLTLNGEVVEAEVSGNGFTYTPADALGDGQYTLVAEVTDGNGKKADATIIFSIRLPVPTVAIHSPHASQVYDNGNPIIAGDFSGAAPIEVSLSIDGEAVEASVNDNNQFTYTPTDALSDGEHVVTAIVTDANGRTAETSTDFTIDIPGPEVAIHAPAAGKMYDYSKPIITGDFSGFAPIVLNLTLNGEVVEAEVSGNGFTYTPADALGDGQYTLVAEVTDGNGKKADATIIFSIRLPVPTVAIQSPHAAQVYENGMPIIAGDFSGAAPIEVSLSIDDMPVEASVNDNNQFTYKSAGVLSDGEHTVSVTVTDANGRTAETSTDFIVDIPGPTVSILSPAAGQLYEHGKPAVRGEFGGETDVDFTLTLDGEVVMATVVDNEFNYTPDPSLDDGEYTLVATVTDANSKSVSATVIFSIELPVPTVAVLTPTAGQVYDHGMPVITGEFSGADPVSGTLSIDGESVNEVSGNDFTYTPTVALSDGAHTVSIEVTDANGRTASATIEFTVDIPGPTVAIHGPGDGQTYNHRRPIISGEFSGADPVRISKFTVAGRNSTPRIDGNRFTHTPNLGDGAYTVIVEVTDANGKTTQASTSFTIKLPDVTVSIKSPASGHTYDQGNPTVSGEFSGVGSVRVTSFTIDNKRYTPTVIGNHFTYVPVESLLEGEHTVSVTVRDSNGKTASTSAIFNVVFPDAEVVILAPGPGQIFDHENPEIKGEFSGLDPVELTFSVNGIDVETEAVVEDNRFTYIHAETYGQGEHTVIAKVTDANGKTAEASVIFTVDTPGPSVAIHSPAHGQMYDHGMPVISVESSGVAEPVTLSVTINGEAANEEDDGSYTPVTALGDGEYTVVATATDANGKTDEATVIFSVEIPGPSVAIHSPAHGQMYDHGIPVISVESSGVAEPVTLSVTIDGEAAKEGDDGSYTPTDALGDGEYTVVAVATDANGKTAKATAIFLVELPVPTASITTPTAGQVYDQGMPVITGEFSGADPVSGTLLIDGESVNEVSGNDFTYTPTVALSDGAHTVSIEVTDANGRTASATIEFTVDIPGPYVAIHSPAHGQIYDHSMPVINVDYSGVAEPVTLSVTVNDEAVTENDDGSYSPATVLGDGEYTVVAEVTDANGKTAIATAIFTVSLPVPTVAIQSPVEGLTYNNGDPVIAGEFTGVAPVTVKLTIDGADAEADVNGNEFNHALADALSHGEHTIAVEITDANGKTAQATTVFIVDIPGPSVAILSPAPGQTYDHGTPVIRAEFSGMTDVTVTTFTINGEDAEAEVEDNQVAYTPNLGNGEHTVFVQVTDENGKTAQAIVVFAVEKDSTPPVISAHSPTGVVQLNKADVIAGNMAITISADISDQESEITSVKYLIDNTPPTSSYPVERAASKFEITESFSPGPHSIKLIVVSEGGTKEFSWQFVLEVDQTAPVISSITPSGTVHAGLPTISASANDESGVESISIVVMDSGGEEVAGETADDSEDRNNEGITRLDFHPEAPLTEGTYAIEVRATDAFGNSSTLKGGFSVDFDTSAPFITTSSPQDGARLMIKHNEESIAPTISITIGDAETGVNVDSIRLSIEAPGRDKADLISLEEGKERSATQVIYTPGSPEFTGGFMVPGEYTVILEVSDNAQQQGNVSEENDGAREANTAVYQFSFFVEKEAGPILAKPINFPNPFAQNTRISFGLNRMSTVSIVIYDSTLRPVRTLRDNVVLSAGDYTGNNGIGWDGKTSGGEDLARGIYFCEIIVTDGFEPEYAILKLALTR